MELNSEHILEKIKKDKFIVVDFDSAEEALKCSHIIGLFFGKKYTMFTLSGCDGNSLPIHTEMIYNKNLLNYFMLLMLSPCDNGGDLVLYDAEISAAKLLKIIPNIKDTKVSIKSKNRTYNLVRNLIDETKMLRFSDTESLTFQKNTTGISDKELTLLIKNVLLESVIDRISLKKNQLIIVDNLKTLHSRDLFLGNRLAIRYRIDDPTLEI